MIAEENEGFKHEIKLMQIPLIPYKQKVEDFS